MNSLPKRLSRCVSAGEPLEHGAEYVSFLDLQGNRKDYCPQCWEKTEKKEEGHFWRGTIPLRKTRVRRPDEKALELFRQVSDPKQRFVLALYLQRKHQLVRRTHTLYEIPETGEVFDVAQTIPTPEEGEALAQEIHSLINDELEDPSAIPIPTKKQDLGENR